MTLPDANTAAWTIKKTSPVVTGAAASAFVTTTTNVASGNVTGLGLTAGSVYEVAVFHADQHPRESNYELTLTGFSTTRTDCAPTCGDGIVTAGEECDLGAANNTGGYNGCNPDCTYGPFCGDSVVNGTEQCDDGVNIGGYSYCAPGCVWDARCGDGIVQKQYGETCDLGSQNGVTGSGCTATCGIPAICGDGVVEAPETCDDGVNDGSYGGCTPDCQHAPYCGRTRCARPENETRRRWIGICDLISMLF